MPDAPLTLDEAAAAAGMSRRLLYDWCRMGHIPGAYRTRGKSGHWRLRRSDFLVWLEAYQSPAFSAPRSVKSKCGARSVARRSSLGDALREIRM